MAKKRAVEEDEDEAPVRRKKKRTSSSRGESAGSSVVTLDFSKDTSEGGRRRFKEADYPFKVKAIKMGLSEQKKTPYCQVSLVFKDKKYSGDVITDRVYITEKALWRIRALFAAAGTALPKKKMKIDFKSLIGQSLWATVVDDEYEDNNGKSKTKSIISDYLEEEPDADDEDDDDEDEDDDEDDDDEDLEDMDVDDDL